MKLTDQYDVLVACSCSGIERDALIAVGVRAISCDLKPTETPGPHYQGDVRNILHLPWRGLVAHPVCRYLANSGAKHLYLRVDGVWSKHNPRNEERWQLMREGAEFFREFDQADHIEYRAVENPVQHGHAVAIIGRRADQYVQPWHFGDPYSKATGWHLTKLPKLIHTHTRADYAPGEIKQAVWKMAPGPAREAKRSAAHPGIVRAVATQWGPYFRGERH